MDSWVMLLINLFAVHGLVLIVTVSNLLDPYRLWCERRSRADYEIAGVWINGYDLRGENLSPAAYSAIRPAKGVPFLLKMLLKLINCWICVSFWAGVALSLFHLSPFQNWILAGIVAVGGIGTYRYLVDKLTRVS